MGRRDEGTGQRGYVDVKAKAGWSLSIILALALGAGHVFGADVPDRKNDAFLRLRGKMVRSQISHPPDYRKPVREKRVLAAMRAVPRHLFVLSKDIDKAYGDHPLPIGYGQTISQPYIVALMTEMLGVGPEAKVLEVGTGSGYLAAILSQLVREVFTVEIVGALGKRASKRLARLDYLNARVKVADGYYGWSEHAPYDGIIVSCATTLVPPPLLKQLKPGGKMVIPVGGAYTVQSLTLVEKSKAGKITMKKMLPVRFVPLTRSLR